MSGAFINLKSYIKPFSFQRFYKLFCILERYGSILCAMHD
jgi:hypothetical protein